jgi:glutamate/tyrosine decarboxylase-like PLP-dependent enzyme
MMEDSIRYAAELAWIYLNNLRSQPVTGDLRTAELQTYIRDVYSFEKPLSVDMVLRDVVTLLQRGGVQAGSPAYFGLFNPSVLSDAIAAATIVAAINPQLGATSHGRAAVLLERHVLNYLASKLGFQPENVAAHFTNGGQEANIEALIVSLTHAFPGLRENGLRSLDREPVAYVSIEAHHSLEKAAHITGIGRKAIRRVPVDSSFAMDLPVLAGMISADRRDGLSPFLVVGTAGSTTTGAIDPLFDIAELCQSEGLWFHCDAAWGGTALLSQRTRPFLTGIERSDSVTWDAHKWLQMPLGTGMFFTSHPAALRAAFSTDSPYMPPRREQHDDLYDVSMQWSRRGAGIPLLVSFAALGSEGFMAMIDRMIVLGHKLTERLRSKGFSIVNDTPLPVICFTHPVIESGRTTAMAIARAVDRSGRTWIAPVELPDGRSVLRACITSHLTEERDLSILIEILEKILALEKE